MQNLKTLLNMPAFILVLLCVINEGVNAFVTETQDGVIVRLNMNTHVFEANQSDRFFFHVKSCQSTHINWMFKNVVVRIDLYPERDLSRIIFCNNHDNDILTDCGKEETFSTPDFCSKPLTFWVKELTYTFDMGSGCKVGDDTLTRLFIEKTLDHGYMNLEISSLGKSEWKFGEDTCVQTTTTVTSPSNTTKTPSPKTTMTTKSGNISDVNQTRMDDFLCKSASVTSFRSRFQLVLPAWLYLLMTLG